MLAYLYIAGDFISNANQKKQSENKHFQNQLIAHCIKLFIT